MVVEISALACGSTISTLGNAQGVFVADHPTVQKIRARGLEASKNGHKTVGEETAAKSVTVEQVQHTQWASGLG